MGPVGVFGSALDTSASFGSGELGGCGIGRVIFGWFRCCASATAGFGAVGVGRDGVGMGREVCCF